MKICNPQSLILSPLLLCLFVSFVAAQTTRPTITDNQGQPIPKELKDVGVEEHLNAQVPMDLVFTDEQGKQVALGEYFRSGRPVILQLGYYGCPMLCGLVTNSLMETMKELPLDLEKDYAVLNISIDPSEDHNLAEAKKRNYLKEFGKSGGEAGWHFLVGSQENITKLTGVVGFKYKWNDELKQFAHAAVLFVLTPEGKISRYLYGVQFPETELRQALVEASQGKSGASTSSFILSCLQGNENKNAQRALLFMRLGGVLTVLILGLVILRQLYRNAHLKRRTG